MVRLGDLLTLAVAVVAPSAAEEVTCDNTPQGWDCPANLGCSTESCTAVGWQDWVAATNLFRCMHNVPSVTWSDAITQDTASHFAGQTNLTHSQSYQLAPPLGPAGENLYLGTSAPQPLEVVRLWYKEVEHCALLQEGCQGTTDKVTGHFTSMVWAGDENIGCAVNSAHLAVCRYKGSDTLTCKTPNMAGGFENNVFAPSKSLSECQAKLTSCGMVAPQFSPNSWELGYQAPETTTSSADVFILTERPTTAPSTPAPVPTMPVVPPMVPAPIPGESMPANEAQANQVGQLSAMSTFSGLWSKTSIRFGQSSAFVSLAFGAAVVFLVSLVVGVAVWARRRRQVDPLTSQLALDAEE